MATRLSLEKAATAWCLPSTSHLVMQPELAEIFACMLDDCVSSLKGKIAIELFSSEELLTELLKRTKCQEGIVVIEK